MKLNVKALTFSLGITWGVYMLFLGWVAAFGWGVRVVEVFSSFYVGFCPSFVGGIVGGIWGFVDGLIAGLIISFLYNAFLDKKKTARAAAPRKSTRGRKRKARK